MRLSWTQMVLAALVLAACKGTEDYLADLKSSHDEQGRLNLGVYDAGLLVHEALIGLMDQDQLTLSQVGRAIHDCGWILERNEVALCRADAVALLAHLTLRVPIPPLEEGVRQESAVGETAFAQIEKLDQASRLLDVELLIEGLSHPDRAVVERNHHQLQELTGERYPADPARWNLWWEEQRDSLRQQAEAASREPLEILAELRYGSLSSARAVLGYLATRLGVYQLPGLDDVMTRAVRRLARQVVVHGVARALEDRDPAVRSEAVRAAAQVLDPSFQTALYRQFQREAEPDVRIHLLQALASYPGRDTLAAMMLGLRDRNRGLALTASRELVGLTGKDLGLDTDAWLLWFEREGKSRWP